MPRLRLTIGAGEQMEPAIVEASSLGLLGTEAVVRIGSAEVSGGAAASGRGRSPGPPTSLTTTTAATGDSARPRDLCPQVGVP